MTAPVRAAIYTRISLDATGEGLGVTRQEEDARKLIADRGWEVENVYSDNSISASDARKVRPGYDSLVKAYEAGAFDALVCWDLDRLTRQPRQLEDWIDAAEGRGLALVTTNGEADLTTDGGRMYARIKLAVARAEVDRKSARQKRAELQRAQSGRAPVKGHRLTGYAHGGAIIPTEADVVRRVFKLFLAGESIRGIARGLEEAGEPTRSGRPWNPATVKTILTNPRYAGRVVYDGEVLEGVVGDWEPIVEAADFDLVQAKLSDPARKTSRIGTDRRNLGSGLYLCDDCGQTVNATGGEVGSYRCRVSGHVSRSRAPIDRYVRDVIVEYLSREGIAARLAELIAPATDEIAPLLDEMQRLRVSQATTDQEYMDDLIDARLHRAKLERIAAKLTDLERQLAAKSPGSALGEIAATDQPAQAFADASLMAQRGVIDALCEVRLRRGTRGRNRFDPETVVINWRR